MLQKISSSGGRVGEGPATGGSDASDEPSVAPWVPPDISQVLRCVQPRRLTQACLKQKKKEKDMKSRVFALFGVFGAVRKCSSHARTIYAEVVEGEGEAQSWRLRVRR